VTDISKYTQQPSKTVQAILDWHKQVGDSEQARGYLGASIIGAECERYLWYVFRYACKPNFDGRMYRLFETGALEEAKFVKELRAIGCEVHDHDQNGEQFEVKAIGGHFSGHMDGCALGIPEAPKTWHVLEFKTHNAKSFKKLEKEGVKASKSQHYSQMMVYMHLTGMQRALYLAKNKDTDELYSERIRHDKTEAEALMERANRVITSSHPPERISGRRDYYLCNWCDAQDVCWGCADRALPVPALSCRQCCYATPAMDSDNGRWICDKHNRGLSDNDQRKTCHDFLVLPGMIAFADAAGHGNNESGEWIEFIREDGAMFQHGNARSNCYGGAELMALQPDQIGDPMLDSAKRLFGAVAAGCVDDVLQRYPEEDSRIAWKGHPSQLIQAWQEVYTEDIRELKPLARFDQWNYTASEYDGGRLAILWKEDVAAEIRQGVE